MADMAPDSLLRRVRWGNVARVLALPAIVVLVVLWPRLSAPPSALPGTPAAPVAPAAGAAGGSAATPGGGGEKASDRADRERPATSKRPAAERPATYRRG